MPQRTRRGHHVGATLIEVLVTVAVTSIGLLGLAGLMIVSDKVDRDAYMDTQASLVAQALIESMHVNPDAVADGKYDGSYGAGTVAAPSCLARGCNASERAEYDRARFEDALRTQLPNARAALTCAHDAGDAVGTGACRLEIRWSERAGSSVRSLDWVFRP